MPFLHSSRAPRRAAIFAAGLYLIACVAWITLSDRLVQGLATSPAQITTLQTLKGWAFAVVSAGALYLVIRHEVAAARQSEARLQLLAEQSLAGVFVLEDGHVADVNARLLDLLGYSEKEQLLSAGRDQVVHPDDFDQVERIFGAGDSDAATDRFRIRLLRNSGEVMHADVVTGRVEVGGTHQTMGLVIDSTQQVLLEKQFRRAQRLETLGQLTGAIAHDFNNFLTAIIGPLEICAQDLPKDHPSREDIQLARATAQRAANLSRQLLTFSKKRIVRRRVLDLNQPISDLQPLLDQLIGEAVSVNYELTDDVLPVLLDPGELEQVLVNLVVNAAEAMPEGGDVTVHTSTVAGSPEFIRHREDSDPGPHAMLQVSDTGMGIPEEVRLQVFEPFFTTKSKGTGLGLSTVFGIVDQAGGFVRVESEPGAGSTFKVFLPLTDRPLDADQPVETDEATASQDLGRRTTAGVTILVVEDEDAVRTVLGRMLKQAGYRAHLASTGEAAFEEWEKHREEIDLLLTDLMLPGITGVEVADQLTRRDPSLPVLFMSGYSGPRLTEQVATGGLFVFLEKPFTMAELEGKVREALTGRPESQ